MARYILAITGASGALYARRVARGILDAGHECHLCITPFGQRLLHDELGIERLDHQGLAAFINHTGATARDRVFEGVGREPAHTHSPPKTFAPQPLHYHPPRDLAAPIASGSFLHDGMVIVPCSSHTLNSIAAGTGDTLVTRAAAVCLKERRPLILAHRESPLTLIDIRSMETLALAGAVIAPCNPGLYFLPKTVDDLIDFVAARLLDLLKVQHTIGARWGESPPGIPLGTAVDAPRGIDFGPGV
jgi:4-hydroxy-3-polyprenylbenzoate decarboxylase